MDTKMLRERKKELGYTNQHIADLSGVPLGTVQKLFAGTTKNPRNDTVQAVMHVLFPDTARRTEKASSCTYMTDPGGHTGEVRDPASDSYMYGTGAKKNEGGSELPEGDWYTYSDYLKLPDDIRVELIDGQFIRMDAPNIWHQMLIGRLFIQLNECQQRHPECMVLLSPLDVILDEDNRTVVQPDIVVICGRDKMRRAGIFGAPDFVIEIISPSTRRKDYTLKAYKYQNALVREYWIVDYERGIVIVYDIENDMKITIYSMHDDIPVAISSGKCVIRMGENDAFIRAAGYGEITQD